MLLSACKIPAARSAIVVMMLQDDAVVMRAVLCISQVRHAP
jgi:hypothetical protein